MTDTITTLTPITYPATEGDGQMTPTGVQSRHVIAARRWLVGGLVAATVALLGWGIATVLAAGGWAWAEYLIFASFLVGAPWTVMGMWNAVIGLWLLHKRDGLIDACPMLEDGLGDEAVDGRVALLMCLRNEDPWRALSRLAAVRRSLDATGQGHAFTFFVLSDSDEPAVIEAEAEAFEAHAALLGPGVVYRRREDNRGYKAGNISDFLRRWGRDFPFFIPLDSDSLMGGETILRLVRTIQKHPRLGILQALSVGTPSASPFARLFQFGMRHGMRSHTAGAIWWHGDACAYWGHNAVIRTAPFRLRCRIPTLRGRPPLGGPVLSHDQIEAALMRRAGYECRILPVEVESFEDNPPTVLDFIKRDHRWCNGNMQYFQLLALPGLAPMSRFQVFAAIAMYFGGPAWMLMTLAAASLVFTGGGGQVDVVLGISMFFIMFSVSLVPKIAGWIDTALTPGGMARYGGGARFAAGALSETLFSMLLAPVSALAVTIFMGGLLAGRTIVWSGQQRDLTQVTWRQALRTMWPQTVLGGALLLLLALEAPGALPWASPALAGLLLAAPLAVATASPALGRWMQHVGICATPEERAPMGVLVDRAAAPVAADRVRAA